MLTAIIVDDEPKLRTVLETKLRESCPDIMLVGLAESATTAYDMIRQHNPDLVFLDIAMPGETGFELLDRFDKINFEIIFVTGYQEYILDALRLSAVDYLLKPIRTSDLLNAVEKASQKKLDKEAIKRYEVLKHNLDQETEQQTKITIPSSDGYDFVKVSEIIRCEGWQKYTRIFLADGSALVSSYNIGVFKQMLKNYTFFYCHKSHLINTEHIKKYLKSGKVVMTDNSEVPISRRRKEEFLGKIVNKH